jgi:hypothetical protein
MPDCCVGPRPLHSLVALALVASVYLAGCASPATPTMDPTKFILRISAINQGDTSLNFWVNATEWPLEESHEQVLEPGKTFGFGQELPANRTYRLMISWLSPGRPSSTGLPFREVAITASDTVYVNGTMCRSGDPFFLNSTGEHVSDPLGRYSLQVRTNYTGCGSWGGFSHV